MNNFSITKKIIPSLTFLFLLILSSCNKSVQEKSQVLVKEWMDKNLNDPSSYTSVEFSNIDTLDFNDTQESEKLDSEIVILKATLMADSVIAEALGEIWDGSGKTTFSDDSDIKIQLINKQNDYRIAEENFKKEIHLFLTHKFRSKNEMGALVLNEMKFQINSDVTLIERYE